MKLKRIMIAAVMEVFACVPAGCGTKPSDKNTLFDSGRVHTIEILIDEADWGICLPIRKRRQSMKSAQSSTERL
jgi:hypothetical protein